MRLTAGDFRRACSRCFDAFFRRCFAVASRGIDREVARRDVERGRGTLRWFTADDAVVAEALARVVVPSDEETPGMDEVCVLDPPAIVALDKLVAAFPYRQHLYSRGLVSFDAWALTERGSKFAELSYEDQVALFRSAEQIYKGRTGEAPAIKKAWRKLRAIAEARNGSFFAAQLFPQLRDDCLQVFYTSRVSWVWLDYDGPPMDEGYPSLMARR